MFQTLREASPAEYAQLKGYHRIEAQHAHQSDTHEISATFIRAARHGGVPWLHPLDIQLSAQRSSTSIASAITNLQKLTRDWNAVEHKFDRLREEEKELTSIMIKINSFFSEAATVIEKAYPDVCVIFCSNALPVWGD
jgi:hypothetical protein